jgi:hypothetical protein
MSGELLVVSLDGLEVDGMELPLHINNITITFII